VLPDSVINAGDTLSFALGNLPAGSDTTVTVNPTVVSELPFAPFPLVNTILASADNAVPPQQSFVDTVLAYIPAEPLTDVCIITTIEADSFVISGNDTTWYVEAGDTFCISMTVKNKGSVPATNVILTYIPPVLTFGSNFSGGDTLTWLLGALPPFADTTITICPTVTDTLTRNNVPLDNTTTVSADNDDPTAPGPNTAQDTLFAFRRLPQFADLSIRKSVQSDSFSVQQGDTTWYIKPNIPFTYTIRVENIGSITAQNVVVTDRLPAVLTALPNTFVPSNGFYAGDSIVWQLGNLAAGAVRLIRFDAVIENTILENNQEVVNTAAVNAANQDTSQTNATVSTSPAIFVRPPLREDCAYFTLDFNVFEPDNGLPLGINFELATAKAAVIELLDISGYRIARLYDETFNAGVNRREWNGVLDNGLTVGSGTYIITLRTKDGKLICWKKVIVRR
jgi:uncharacterized repeat protein (TIGR01451 family)